MDHKTKFTLLHELTRLFQNREMPVSELLHEIILLLPMGWQYPEITAARIIYDGDEFATSHFLLTPWIQSAEFKIDDKQGILNIVYLKEKPAKDEGPFLHEERWLIDYIANILKIYIEFRRTAEALARSEQNLKLLTANIPAIVFRGYADWTMDFFDNRVEEITGYPKEIFHSRQLKLTDIMLEEDIKDSKNVFIQALRTKTAYVREFGIKTRNGDIKWIQERSCILLNEEKRIESVNGIFFDITDRKKTEEELRKYREQLEELVQNRTYDLMLANEQLQWEIGERKQAEEALQKAHEQLEQRVEERTEELRQVNIELKREIEERIQAEDALRGSREELRFLHSELITAQENERRRISRELHDELGQSLAGLKIYLTAMEGKFRKDQKTLKKDCARLLAHIDEIIENVRRLSKDLSPVLLELMGLSAALKYLFSDISEHQRLGCTIDIDEIDKLFSKHAQITIYRIFQECLTNIVRHSQATHFSVVIKDLGNHISLMVQDNGKGFNVKRILTQKASQRGIGIAAMQERVRMLGGTLDIWSQENSGTRITYDIPSDVRNVANAVEISNT